MSGAVKISFGPLSPAPKGSATVIFVGADMKPAAAVTAQFGDLEPLIRAAARASNFRAAPRTALDILAPAGIDASRLGGYRRWSRQGQRAGRFHHAWRIHFRQGDRREASRGRISRPRRERGTAQRPPILRSAFACAATGSINTRRARGNRRTTAPRRPILSSARAMRPPRARLRRSASLSPKASSWRAIWSTSRPTSSFPSSSPIAPKRWRNSASTWRRSTRRRWANWG